jgi:hypothetical protein
MDQFHPDGIYTSFLHLPCEIRQQIYRDVLELNPRVERELPGYPARHIPRYVTAPITPPTQSQIITCKAASYRSLPSYRPLGYIPHNLLRTCKQVYYEARLLPFQTNEFVFTQWMTSATCYCEAVLRPMQPWQRDAIRHVRFAMGLEELSDRSSVNVYACQLERVCALLPAVRTMRMDLSCRVSPTEWFEKDDKDGVTMRDDWSGGRRWIDEGLRKMGALRVLEIECSFVVWMTPSRLSLDEKKGVEEELALGWCGKVDEILNEGRPEEMKTRVVAVANAQDSRSGLGAKAAEEDALTLSHMPSGLGVYSSGPV